MFEIEISTQSAKFLQKSPKDISTRIREKIKLLKADPVPHNSMRIIGEERTFRIRIGDYRVLYEIKWGDNKILIVIIDKRSRVYEK